MMMTMLSSSSSVCLSWLQYICLTKCTPLDSFFGFSYPLQNYTTLTVFSSTADMAMWCELCYLPYFSDGLPQSCYDPSEKNQHSPFHSTLGDLYCLWTKRTESVHDSAPYVMTGRTCLGPVGLTMRRLDVTFQMVPNPA